MLQKSLIAVAAYVLLASAAHAQEAPSAEQCAREWNAVLANETPTTLEAFIASFGVCAEADQARQDLIALSNADDAAAVEEEPRGSGGTLSGVVGGVPGRTTSERASPAPPAPPAPGSSAPVDRTVYVAAGRILMRGQPMIAEGGGYGVILLRRGGVDNLAACEVFVRSLGFTNERVDGVAEQIDGAYVYRRPIYWPTLHNVSATRASDCATMLANYDYVRAAVMLARLRASQRTGPLMVVWRADGGAAGLFDYSELPRAELDRQFDRSLVNLAQSDQIWTASFYEQNAFQRALRSLLNTVTEPAKYVSASLISFARPTIGLAR